MNYPFLHYRIDTLPYDIREQAIDKVKECFKLNISKQPTLYRKLHTLIKVLQDKNNTTEHMDKFVQITKLYDKHRNQSIENSLPDLYKHVKKYF